MVPDNLTPEERKYLLDLARQSLEKGVRGEKLPEIDIETLTPRLRSFGASFVTLTEHGNLRGCIGALEPYQSLAEDVREHAVAAALDDYRFSPVQPAELSDINIEISRLTIPVPLEYNHPEDIPHHLTSGGGWGNPPRWDPPGNLPAPGVGENCRRQYVFKPALYENGSIT